MKEIMDWSVCKEKCIRTVEVDPAKIKSIGETAKAREEYIKSTNVTSKNVSFVVEGQYEVIKELLVALLLKAGLRSRNHQCLISYFYHHFPQYEAEAHSIAHLSYLRNRLNYYGEQIDLEFYEKNKESIKNVIDILVQRIQRKTP